MGKVGQRSFRARRWPLRVASLGVLLLLAGAVFWFGMRPQSQAFATLPPPDFASSVVEPTTPQALGSTEAENPSEPEPEPEVTDEELTAISASPAVQLFIPNSDAELALSTPVLPMHDCRTVIDPPRDPEGFGQVYGCSDFAQPGSDSPSLTVLAGHSAQSTEAAFNRLYRQGESLEGREVYIRTEASGDRWLVYRIDNVYVPDKEDLPYMAEVWGAPGESTAGRLLLVTCRQQPGLVESVQNYVAVGQLVGVR
jgi:hypothetical protein